MTETEGKIMKKILIATTALVATAGVAAAEVSVSGWAYASMVSGDALTDDGGSEFTRGGRLQFGASTETDNGVSLSYYSRMTSYNGSAGEAGLQWNRVTMAMDNFTLQLGNANGAARTGGRAAIGYIGVDNGSVGVNFNLGDNSFAGVHTDGGDNAVLTYRMGSVAIAASAQMDGEGETEFGIKYSEGPLTVGFGGNGNNDWMAMASYKVGALTFAGGSNSDEKTIASVAYDMGNGMTFTALTADQAAGGSYGVDVSCSLGGGATLSAQVGENAAGETGAAVGIFFSF